MTLDEKRGKCEKKECLSTFEINLPPSLLLKFFANTEHPCAPVTVGKNQYSWPKISPFSFIVCRYLRYCGWHVWSSWLTRFVQTAVPRRETEIQHEFQENTQHHRVPPKLYNVFMFFIYFGMWTRNNMKTLFCIVWCSKTIKNLKCEVLKRVLLHSQQTVKIWNILENYISIVSYKTNLKIGS